MELVNKILEESPETPNESYLEILANYLIIPIEREERKKHKYLTDNRLSTINKRETSFEGLVSQLENGEDGIYNLINNDRGKDTILQPKILITKKDLDEIPQLKQIREAIEIWETKLRTASGREAFIIKNAIINLRKDQYILRNSFRQPITLNKITHSKHICLLDEDFTINEKGRVESSGVSLCNPNTCSAILCNYSKLKADSWGEFEGDIYFLMEDFDQLANEALKEYPLYEQIVSDKIDGMQNVDIQKDLYEKFGVKHSLEYISSLWRKKIPNLIASAAEDQVLYWYYLNKEKGKYKKCSRCGQVKLANNKYFSKNKTSKDGFYSICKDCRNKKGQNT